MRNREQRREDSVSEIELLAMMAELRIGPDVDAKGLRNAFFQQIKAHHSDRGGDTKKAQDITRAYRVLKRCLDEKFQLPGLHSRRQNGVYREPSASSSARSGCRPNAQGSQAPPDGFEDFGDFQDTKGRRRRRRGGGGRQNGTGPESQENGSDEEASQENGSGGQRAKKKFINNYTYEPEDFSTYDDPMERRDRQKDGVRKVPLKMHALCCKKFALNEDDSLFEIQIPPKNFDADLLTTGLHVDVRAPSDQRFYASAVIEQVKHDIHSIVAFFVDPLRLVRVLNLGKQVNVTINCSAFVYRSQLRSLENIENSRHRNMAQIVFPKPTFEENFELFEQKRASALQEMSWREEQEHNYNTDQKNAIYSIVSKAHHPWPFVLFGPPGTGKTITLIEAIRHLVSQSAQHRILVCTPSKMAADNFAEALLDHNFIEPKYVYRMHSLSTMAHHRNKRLDCISYLAKETKNRFFGIPDRHNLKVFRVIISTLSTSSYLISAGGLRGFFTHLIIDEASQATEPETWVPIGGLVGSQTSVVLAGDPNQLGPVVRPENLKWFGLDSSMMKRIMSSEESDNWDDRFCVTLRQTYRSHCAILRPCSYLFYNNILQVDDGQGDFHKLTEWQGLPALGFPVIFHSSKGSRDEQGINKSFQNQFEAELVRRFVDRLLSETDTDMKKIGVISPYRNQVVRLRQMFSGYSGLTIDSVEGFQGSEREVIIISTVRQHDIGFLRCDLRLNTSISRAKYLLIVIGNEDLLSQHITWKKFIHYCRFHGGFLNSNGEKMEPIEEGEGAG